MHLHFLGTSSGSPAIERNVSCTALNLLPENGEIWLFDCGEATQHQILRTSIRPGKIRRIFITHLHGDHIFGLLGLLCSRSFLSGEQPGPLTLYGGAGLREFVETGLRLSRSYLSYPIEFVELSETGGEIACDAAFRVKYRLLDHAVPSFGFRVIEADRPGSLKTDALEALGVPKGALYGALKRGETITLPNGNTLNGKDFIHPPRKGREVVLFGDTRFQAAFADFCADADALVHAVSQPHQRQVFRRSRARAACRRASRFPAHRIGARFYGSADSVARGSLKTLAPSVFRLPVDAYNE